MIGKVVGTFEGNIVYPVTENNYALIGNGTAYLDTGISIGVDDIIEVMTTQKINDVLPLNSYRDSDGFSQAATQRFHFGVFNTARGPILNAAAYVVSTEYTSPVISGFNNFQTYNVKLATNYSATGYDLTVLINGTQIDYQTNTPTTNQGNANYRIWIFGIQGFTTGADFGTKSVQDFQIKRNGVVVFDGKAVPAGLTIDSFTMPATVNTMFDSVSGLYLPVLGTGSFGIEEIL